MNTEKTLYDGQQKQVLSESRCLRGFPVFCLREGLVKGKACGKYSSGIAGEVKEKIGVFSGDDLFGACGAKMVVVMDIFLPAP